MTTAEIEVLSPGTYTRSEFDADRDAVEQTAQARAALFQRLEDWDEQTSLDMARRLLRMRESDYWRGPGTRGSDREFYEWVTTSIDSIGNRRSAMDYLQAGRALKVLESPKVLARASTLPNNATQIRALGSAWYLERPKAIVNIWQAAVDDATDGQPGSRLVAEKASRYKADLQSVEEPAQQTADQVNATRRLRGIRQELIDLHSREPELVEAFLRELSAALVGGAQ